MFCAVLCTVCVDGAFAGESVACGMPCGHVPNLYLTSHLTPRLAVSVRRVFVSSRVMLSRASRTYVLCRGVWCAVCPQRCAFRAAGAWDALWARTIYRMWSNYHSKFFAPSTGILYGAHGV